jgi:serine phosphatase RsbU (regulator of sigma subunit)/anti-sigma regulatory factor (Ser/Thr protein kinase)
MTDRAEAALGYVDRVPVGMGTLDGPDSIWAFANPAYDASVARRDLVGRPVREVFPEFEGQGVFELLERVRRTREPTTADEFRLAVELDGRLEERVFEFNLYPSAEKADDGGALHVDVMVVDVTERAARQLAAERAAAEAERRYADARAVVGVLQESLLTTDLVVLPGLDLAASYLLADEELAAGGDWFDAVVRPSQRVALVVGDVVGHGVRAAAVMGQLRAVLRDRLGAGERIDDALTALDRFARGTDGAAGTSVCVLEIGFADGVVEYCTAGHPPPLVVAAEGGSRYLPGTGARLLGQGGPYPTLRTTLATDEVVVLYSDGLVERPGREVTDSTVEVRQLMSDAVLGRAFPLDPAMRTVDRVTLHGLEALTRVTGYADDITLLAAQRTVPVTPLDVTLPAVPESVAEARARLDDWLHAVGVGAATVATLQHAVGELVSNSIEHAYGPDDAGTGTVELAADLDATGVVHATVRDRGAWRPPTSEGRSRGLAMARHLADDLRLDHGRSGTVAEVRLRATRDAVLLPEARGARTPRPAATTTPFALEQDDDTLRVSGPVDLVASVQLQHAVDDAGSGGARPVRVDLSGVTHLGSAGVKVLDDATAVTLLAPYGSTAQHVLDLVGLPFTTP